MQQTNKILSAANERLNEWIAIREKFQRTGVISAKEFSRLQSLRKTAVLCKRVGLI